MFSNKKRKIQNILNKLTEKHLIDCATTIDCVTPKMKEKRKNVDYQWSEYIVYIICKGGEKINSFEEFEKTFDNLIEHGYLTDLLKADKKKVMNYYNRFHEEFHALHLDVSKVFLLGKNQSKFEEIKKIHVEHTDAKLKADILVKTTNDTFVGFSVKSSEQDTLTNYSIYKMLPKDEVELLKEIQINMLKTNNLSVMKDIYKKNREKYNKLFANSSTIDNEYHITLNELILEHKEDILRDWYKNLFGKMPYELYTFNGKDLTNDTISPLELDIKAIQNPAKKDNTNAAKLFYALYDHNCVLYKWEVRWKGDIFVSPQILTFKWNPEKDHLKLIKPVE
jgi:hypothetical protein